MLANGWIARQQLAVRCRLWGLSTLMCDIFKIERLWCRSYHLRNALLDAFQQRFGSLSHIPTVAVAFIFIDNHTLMKSRKHIFSSVRKQLFGCIHNPIINRLVTWFQAWSNWLGESMWNRAEPWKVWVNRTFVRTKDCWLLEFPHFLRAMAKSMTLSG